MKRSHVFGLILSAAVLAPMAASADIPLQASQNQRQAVLEQEYQLNVPGLPPAQAAAAQGRATALETQINGTQAPPLAVPEYGGCDADRSALAYLQDELANGDLDEQQAYTDRRNIYDLGVNLRQRGC